MRGYTGHEMLPEFGLINMNGRLYDPVLGRFLSPDNYVQMPDFSQSFNRYAYCINNPLKYNDPSGELFGLDDAFLIFGLASGALMGAAQADMNGGNFWAGALKGLVTSALSTIGTAGIGQALGHAAGTIGTELLRAGLHGLNNGIISAINGNNFGTGFLTGSISSFAGSGAQMAGFSSLGVIASTTTAGALTSAILGGSWLDGAMTGMNIGMLNHEGKVINDGDGTLEAVEPLPEIEVIGHRRVFNVSDIGLGFSTYAANRYYKSSFGFEYWKTSSGKYYTSSVLQRQSNGKFVRGVQGIRNSRISAMNSVKMPNFVGKTLGRLSVGINVVDVLKKPTVNNFLSLSRSIGSYYSLPYAVLDIYASCAYYDIQNTINLGRGFPGTYSAAVMGYYAYP